jgi:phytoene dehydrogenase-like protein
MQNYDAIVIGTGMGSLTTACLLAQQGLRCLVVEQNYLAGGCTTSYWRKGFVFESGATTLVGLDEGMPLHGLVGKLGINLPATRLKTPMKVHLRNGQILTRYENLEEWIAEAERVFGKKNQRPFWKFCYKLSQFVWRTSLKQTAFPPTCLQDLWHCAKNASLEQFWYARYAFYTMDWLLRKFGLHTNRDFVEFVDEQLLITAQNHAPEVNLLFGATALCYTNYGNYYVEGGLFNLVNPFLTYLNEHGAAIHLRERVEQIRYDAGKYCIQTDKGFYTSEYLIAGIPLNNLLDIYAGKHQTKWKSKILPSEKLNSAFQMGVAFWKGEEVVGWGRGEQIHELASLQENRKIDVWERVGKEVCLHHQIHLEKPLPTIESASIFVSLSHPDDKTRSDKEGYTVASVSTHLRYPETNIIEDKQLMEDFILQVLEDKGFLKRENIAYYHSSTQKSWAKWTGRKYGFVGGYPQYKNIKPWQMPATRIDGKKAYLCGDTAYPGQGIPGVVLSGIIAFEQLKRDHNLR